MNIWVHTLVKNEDRYLWYAVRSVIDHVERVLLWDTGSTDKTADIIKELKKRYPSKISFKEVGDVSPDQYTIIRQKMLSESKCDWFLNVDGDEVWWNEKIREVKSIIDTKGKSLDTIVSRYFNIIGDIYHFQEERAGKYIIDGKEGNLTIRAVNRGISDLRFENPHGHTALYDEKNTPIQERDAKKRVWIEGYSFMHFTNIQRSSDRGKDLLVPKRSLKYKYEIGHSFPNDFYYPDVFFMEKPDIVDDVWKRADVKYVMRSLVETPLKKIKRFLITRKKSGY